MTNIELIDKLILFSPVLICLCFLIIILAFPSKHIESKNWLNLLWLCSLFTFLGPFMYYIYPSPNELFFEALEYGIILCTIVFRYFYTLSLTNNFVFIWKKHFYHFTPAIFITISLLILFSVMSSDQRFFYYTHHTQHSLLISNPEYRFTAWIGVLCFQFFFTAQIFIYNIKILLLIKKHRKAIQNSFSYTQHVDLSWLWRFTVFVFIAKLLGSLQLFLSYQNIHVRIVISLFLIVALVYFGILSLSQKEIYPHTASSRKTGNEEELTEEKEFQETNLSLLSGDAKSTYGELKLRLIDYFEKEKPYLNQDLKIEDLCLALNSNKNYISKIINDDFGMNFCSFVNKYRVENAKSILIDSGYVQYSIKGIAEMSGFKSLSSFNAFFKQFEGITPSDYRNKLIISQ
jgi:AraC-like DNA-binding protein